MDQFRENLSNRISGYTDRAAKAEDSREFASMHINLEFRNLVESILSEYDEFHPQRDENRSGGWGSA